MRKTEHRSTDLPRIDLLEAEAEQLTNAALALERREPDLADLLLREIERAHLHPAGALPEGVICIGAMVEFVDEGSGVSRTVQLVNPADADISANRISVLTPIGAGLIGVSEGRSILWPDRDGKERRLRIVKVVRPQQG